MKKIFTLSYLTLLLLGFSASAQSTRMVLAEDFTQASCPPCASQNPAFNTLLEANSTKICAIKYQTSWPGSDPMNASTQSLVGPRVSYYNVSGVPWAAMDGTPQTGSSYSGAPANWTQAKINTRANVTSPFTLTVAPLTGSPLSPVITPVTFLSCAWTLIDRNSKPILRNAKQRNFLINKRFNLMNQSICSFFRIGYINDQSTLIPALIYGSNCGSSGDASVMSVSIFRQSQT